MGCAVGLGNLWRFPYTVAEHGGAAFVLAYLILTAAVGVPLLMAELAVGRRAAAGPVEALAKLGGEGWRPLGWALVLGVSAMLAYYAVIGGWTLRYAATYLVGQSPADPASFFNGVASGQGAIVGALIFLALCGIVVARGIRGGIERLATWLLPFLFVSVVGLAVYAATLDSAGAAYRFLLRPDFGELRGPTPPVRPSSV